jgi:nickel-dependent lactate racemase
LPDLDAALASALERPLGSAPVRELVKPGARVTIAFDDPTGPSYGPIREKAIKLVLAELERAGVSDDRMTLLRELAPSQVDRR